MLPKIQRLSKADLAIKTHYQTFSTPLFSVRIRKNDVSTNRFGFIISKKINKRAVVRNRLKRQMSVAVGVLPKEQGNDYIFYMKKVAINTSTGELRATVNRVIPGLARNLNSRDPETSSG